MRSLQMCTLIVISFLFLFNTPAFSNPATGTKTKFYNFDDLLINGEVKKPQVLYTSAREKVKFERLLRLKRDFLPKLTATKKDPTLR